MFFLLVVSYVAFIGLGLPDTKKTFYANLSGHKPALLR